MKLLLDLISIGKDKGASDLHLEAGSPAVFRIRGDLVKVGEPVNAQVLSSLVQQILSGNRWDDFKERRSADLSKTLAGVRCRINCFQTVKGMSMAIRLLSSFKNTLRDSNLHPDLKKLIQAETGLVIISGPTGSGKSTTLAALIEEVNQNHRQHVITIESPVEYFFQNKQSFIRQREIPLHSPSFEQAIIDSMREDPDLLVIGEMREPQVMRLTLNAAETGHLVLATLHSSSCAEAISRLAMSFAPEIQPSIRAQIADSLVAVVCQRLTYLPHFKIQVPVLEIMMATSAVKSSIRSGAISQLPSVIQTGGEDGMYTFDRYQRWIEQKKDWVNPSQASPLASDPIEENAVPLAFSKPAQPTLRNRLPSIAERVDPDRIEISVDDADLERLAKQIASQSDDD
jgi:twitching motility protein PilT